MKEKIYLEDTVGVGTEGAALTDGFGLTSAGIGFGVGAGLESSFSTDSASEAFFLF